MRKIAAHYVFPISAPPIRNGIVTLSDDGEILGLGEMNEEAAGVEFYNGALVPGFVNAHCHLELSYMRGKISEHTGLKDFLLGVVNARRDFTNADIAKAISLADAQLYAAGTVAVGDISNTDVSFELKAKSSIFYHTFIEVLDLWRGNIEEVLARASTVITEAEKKSISNSLTAHAPYSTSANMLRALAQKSKCMSVHNQECADENLFFEQGGGMLYDLYSAFATLPSATGRTSIHHMLENLPEVENLLLVHNTHTSADDYDYAVACNKKISWVLCPRSNLYIENALPPLRMLRSKGARIALGTDSLSSNYSLNMLDELKCTTKYFPDVALDEMLRWATLGGAEALGKEDTLGSFELGKHSGVVLLENLNLDKLELTPKTTSRLLTKK